MNTAKLNSEHAVEETRELVQALRDLRIGALRDKTLLRRQQRALLLVERIISNALSNCDRVFTSERTRSYAGSATIEQEVGIVSRYLRSLDVAEEDILFIAALLQTAEPALSQRLDTRPVLQRLRRAAGRSRGALRRRLWESRARRDAAPDDLAKGLGDILVAAVGILANTVAAKMSVNPLFLFQSFASAGWLGTKGFLALRAPRR